MKRIAICGDGTWNKPDQKIADKRKPTNVTKFARAILPVSSDGITQVVAYHTGVGTHWGLDRIIGGGLGVGLSANVLDMYRFLVHNFVPDDEIYLFGFSRGAYTVRSLAGLIYKIGIVDKEHAFFIPDGFDLYRQKADEETLVKFRSDHGSRMTRIKAVGVWDTVGALGVPAFKFFGRKFFDFHDVKLTPIIENGFQALSIDEQRRPFKPSLWELSHADHTLKQVWFSGVHSNVGGGYPQDGLANIAMHWMKDEVNALGLEFDEAFLRPYGGRYSDTLYNSMSAKYRAFGRYSRPIGTSKNGNESVHPTAIERFKDAAQNYRPSNLVAYLEQHALD